MRNSVRVGGVVVERDLGPRLRRAAQSAPVVTVTGPRQSGKTTLCRTVFDGHRYVSLEALDVRAFAVEDPRGFLAQFPDGAVIDEIQRAPDLPSYLQVLIDDDPAPGRWILTGSQHLGLLDTVSQSLAGRTALLNLLPLSYGEILRFGDHEHTLDEVLLTGGYPRIYDRGLDASEWLGSYIATYLERDVRSVRNVGDLDAFGRFLQLCAGRTAQLVNHSTLAADCGVSQPTAKAWLAMLDVSFVAMRLPAFWANLRKRLVKQPKLHFYDTGLVCRLLGIYTADQLRTHPLRGAIFETWVLSEIVKRHAHLGSTGSLSFYRDRSGVEADLVLERPGRLVLIESKSAATVSADILRSARRAASALAVHADCEIVVVYGGDDTQERTDATVLGWRSLHTRAGL